ncbi:MAG TPA: DUF885 domain-containing protein, partial [Allosphingosinicella sp.]
MKLRITFAALLLATAACTATGTAEGAAGAASAPAASAAAEDARLNAFLDAAFEESIATNPQFLTSLGSKRLYHRLNDYTDAYRQQQLALSEAQLA